MKTETIRPVFVEFIPEDLEEGHPLCLDPIFDCDASLSLRLQPRDRHAVLTNQLDAHI